MTRDKPSIKVDLDALRKDVQQNLDHYQYERAKKFGVAQSTIAYALKRLGVSNKKTLFYPKVDETSRLIFQLNLFRYELIEKRPIVYIDERGFTVDTPRERGYSQRGEKYYAYKN